MGERPQPGNVALDWVIRARRYEYHLSSDTPLSAGVNLHLRPRPLELDIHDGIELGVLLQGAEERHYQDYVLRCRPGDVWMCAMWEPHGWRITAPNTRNVVSVFLPEFLGEEMVGDIPWLSLLAVPPDQRPTASSPQLRKQVLAIGRELEEEVQKRKPAWVCAARLHLLRLLLTLSRRWKPPALASGLPALRPHNLSRIMPAVALVHANPDRRVGTKEAAAACGLSRAQFNRIFTQTMRMSFARFCLRARLAFVAHRLLTSDLSTEGIAEEAGFVDASHLHRAFVKDYGCTPGRYREQGR